MSRPGLWACAIALPGCVFIVHGNGSPRIDQDGDNVVVGLDCNDKDPELALLSAIHGELACGDVVTLDYDDATTTMDVHVCPLTAEWVGQNSNTMTELIGPEFVFSLSVETPTDVDISTPSPDVVVFAYDGPECSAEACVTPNGDRTLRLRAEPYQTFYVLVDRTALGVDEVAEDIELTVDCAAPDSE